MSWTGPEGSQTLGCLLTFYCSQWLFRIIIKLVGSSWTIFHENHGVHPASQIIYLRKNVCCSAVYIKQRWFYDSLETLLWWKGSMASRWMFESCAASTAIWVLRCFESLFCSNQFLLQPKVIDDFGAQALVQAQPQPQPITSTTQLPEVAASTKECLFLQTGVGYIFAQAAWHLKLSTTGRGNTWGQHVSIFGFQLKSFLGYVLFKWIWRCFHYQVLKWEDLWLP